MAGPVQGWTPRLAGNADASALARVHLLARRVSLPYLPRLHTPEQTAAFFRDTVLVTRAVWCIDHAGSLNAFIAFGESWVDHLYVHPDHHGAGMGSSLLRLAQGASPSLQLWVFQRNLSAIRFYEKRGFTVAKITDGSGNKEREPDMCMSWTRPDDWPP